MGGRHAWLRPGPVRPTGGQSSPVVLEADPARKEAAVRYTIELRVDGRSGPPVRVALARIGRLCRGAEDVGLRLEEAKGLLDSAPALETERTLSRGLQQ
jgi:hypothetical protein